MDDHINNLYEADFLVWINTQAELLRTQRLDQLDLENLIEELEGMARAQKREFKHRIEQLLLHLLKCKLQPERMSGSWRSTIREQRDRIRDLLQEMPSLKPLLQDCLTHAYVSAAKHAADQTRLPLSAFPEKNPFTMAQIFDDDFWPGENNKAADP